MSLKNKIGFKSLLNSLNSATSALDQEDTRNANKVKFSYSDIVLSNFAMMYFQDASMLQFQKKMEEDFNCSNLETLFGVKNTPSESTMRTLLDAINVQTFAPVFVDIIKKLSLSKELDRFQMVSGKYLCAIDGSQYYSSKKVSCQHCLTKNHKNGECTHQHQALVAALMNPKIKQVLPLMPEEIRNEDGNIKQDCEVNAAKRLIPKLKEYGLPLIITGDALFANQNIIELCKQQGFSYMLTCKSETLIERVNKSENLRSKEIIIKDKTHVYEWLNQVSLNYNKETIFVNYFSLKIINNKTGEITYKNSWITDLKIEGEFIETFVEAARSRWKIENECFNVLKNNGYELEHNYGHGKEFLAGNYFLLTILSHLFHQIHELVEETYQKLRIKKGSLKVFWNDLKAAIKMIIFDDWEQLMNYLLSPPRVYASQLMS